MIETNELPNNYTEHPHGIAVDVWTPGWVSALAILVFSGIVATLAVYGTSFAALLKAVLQ